MVEPIASVLPIASWKIDVAVRALHFFRSPDGRVIVAVLDTSGRIRLHDPEQGGAEINRRRKPVSFQFDRPAPVYDLTHRRRPATWPDLVAVGGGSTTGIFDLSSGEERLELTLSVPEELRVVESMSAPDGSAMIAVAGRGNTVYLWREGADEPEELTGHTGPVRVLDAVREEWQLAVADEVGITLWDVSGPTAARCWSAPGRCRSLAVLREQGGVRLASATADGIHLWQLTGERVAHLAQAHSVASVVAFDAEQGEQMLAVASDRTVALWSPATEALSKTQLAGVPEGTLKVLTRIQAGHGTLLAAGDEQGNVTVWRLVPRRWSANMVGEHDDWVNSLAVVRLADRRPLLASVSDDRTLRLWDIAASRPYGQPVRLQSDTQVQSVAALDVDLVVGDQLGQLHRSTVDGVATRWEEQDGYGPIRAMTSFRAPEGWRVVTAGGSGHCLIRDEAGAVVRGLRPQAPDEPLDPAAAPVRAVAAARLVDGRWLVAAGNLEGTIAVWDAATGEPYWEPFEAHPNEQVRSLTCVRIGERVLLASGGSAGNIRLWDLAGQALVDQTTAHGGPVSALCPVWDGRAWLLVSGGADRDIRLWDPEVLDPALSEVINAHEGWVKALVAVPTRVPDPAAGEPVNQLASGGEEGSIRVWQIRDRQLVYSTYGPSIRGFRDRLADVDLLSREAVTEELFQLLSPSPAAESPPADTTFLPTTGPQVLLIHGAWGTGKSSLMRDLRIRLDPDSDRTSPPEPPGPGEPGDPAEPPGVAGVRAIVARARARNRWRERQRELSPRTVSRTARTGLTLTFDRQPVSRTVTAWFNPWQHQSADQVWSGLAWTIVEATRDQLGTSKAERQRYWLSRNLHRLDRGALRRSVRLRIWRPFVVTVAALLAPLALLLVRIGGVGGDAEVRPSVRDYLNLLPGQDGRFPGAAETGLVNVPVVDLLTLALGLALVVVGLVHGAYSVWQYYRGRASAHLPADIFDGPIDQAAETSAAGERLLREQPYLSTAGRLHRINQDIEKLIDDLHIQGYQLIVFIDDLDRCAALSTVEVFEAVNAFLSDQTHPDSAPRFVIGMDSTVVANRLAAGYPDIALAVSAADPDDPNVGWGILRKLSQLTVVLPEIRFNHAARLLRQHAGIPAAGDEPATRPASRSGGPVPRAGAPASPRPPGPGRPARPPAVEPAAATRSPAAPARLPDPRPVPPGAVRPAAPGQRLVALESEPAIQAHLRALTELRARQSMRETKRLVTLWCFYLRLLARLQPPGAMATVQDGCDAMTLAEIIRRWPALVPALGRTGDGPSGLTVLVKAATGPADEAGRQTWWAALRSLGLNDNRYAQAVRNLHHLLRRHGNENLARFADLLL